MRGFLGRVSEWCVTHPAPTIAGVISLVAIIGVVGALRLTPDAGTDKLVDNGSAAFEGTQEFRARFGDDAIVILAQGDLRRLVEPKRLARLQKLEACLAGNAPTGDPEYPAVCQEITALQATRVVFGPATFLRQATDGAAQQITTQLQQTVADAQAAAGAAARKAKRQGFDEADQQIAASAAAEAEFGKLTQQFQDLAIAAGDIDLPDISNPVVLQTALQNPQLISSFISSSGFTNGIVFDSRLPSGTPKAKFGYLFPSSNSALISLRLKPDIDNETRRKAIDLIRAASSDPAFSFKGGSYAVSGVPVVVEGLAEELGSQIFLLLGVAIAVMAMTLIFAFGPPLRLLPLFVALGASAVAFGLLSIIGGTLTMASVAVLPVVIGLGVDYAVQLQARFREATERGERPAPAAVIAAVRGGPVIGTAALATAVGLGALMLSPIPMVREFALALVIGIAAALSIAITAGLAALSMVTSEQARPSPMRRLRGHLPSAGERLAPTAEAFAGAGARTAGALRSARVRLTSGGRTALGYAIAAPGRVLVLALLLAAVGWVAGTRTGVTSDIRELVPADLPALQSVDELQTETGVSGELNVIVSGEDVTSVEALSWMGDFKERVLSEHGFGGEFPNCRAPGTELCPGPALSDLIQSDTQPSQDRIDGVLDAVPPYFLDAILSRPEGQEEVAVISFLIPVMPLDEQEALIGEIRSDLANPPAGLSAEVVGLPVLAADANSELAGSRYWLTLLGLFAVALVLFAVYRRPGRALVPLIPIAMATGWSALVVESMGIPLNPMSATLGVLVIAVATEFSVILSARYYEERAGGHSIGEALRLTYSRTGAAVLVSGITSIAGFGVLVASGITMLRDFGLVTVVDLSASLLGVMLVLPAALVWAEGGFRPFPELWARLRGSSESLLPESAETGSPGSAG